MIAQKLDLQIATVYIIMTKELNMQMTWAKQDGRAKDQSNDDDEKTFDDETWAFEYDA